MKKFYQKNWHNINFKDCSSISDGELVGAKFYNSFYVILFNKYKSYDELDPIWRQKKNELSDWLRTKIPGGARVLSIGCGLGYIEQRLWLQSRGELDLHVQDYATDALKWLKQVLPADRIHNFDCGLLKNQFDFIYLSAVDYAIGDYELVQLLSNARMALREGGQVLIISASFIKYNTDLQLVQGCSDAIKWLLDKLGLRERGHFWGWMRTRQEYKSLMRQSGLVDIVDGFVDVQSQPTYYIKGRV